MKNKSLLIRILSFFKYQKPKDLVEFYIPEVNEEGGDSEQPHPVAENKGTKERKGRKIKKPRTVSELKKEKETEQEQEKRRVDKNSISDDIEINIEFIKKKFNAKSNRDIVIREFCVAEKYRAFIVYLEGMVDRITINNFILRPLLTNERMVNRPEDCKLDYILENVIETNQAIKVRMLDEIVYGILTGNTGLYVQGCDYFIICETKGYEKRGVEPPQIEGVVKGAQEGFNENLRTNITLIRRIIKNHDLITEMIKIGERNHNQCALVYLEGLVNPAIVKEVKRRINGLKTDYIAGSGMLEQFIEDSPYSIVPSTLSTERPDRTASHIVEGRVAILAEGTPFAIVVPVTLASLMHTPEEASLRWQYGTLVRFVRVFAAFVATLLPGLYVALTNFHREMIPTDLLIAIAKARENVPFPTIIEVILMELAFELIREAGIRIPGIIGNTLGIIGALILGQAAVQANLVSPVLIIIVAFTGLGNFAIPDFSLAFAARITRVFYIILGSILGFYGIALGILSTLTLLVNQKSFGVPMFSSLAPKVRRSADLVSKMAVWKQETRPDFLNPLDVKRQPKVSRRWTVQNAQVPERDKKGEEREDE